MVRLFPHRNRQRLTHETHPHKHTRTRSHAWPYHFGIVTLWLNRRSVCLPFLVRLNRTHTTHNTHPQMIKIDDRNEAQQHTHRLAIVARDVFMSGWGQCTNGVSRCAWALHPDVNSDRVFNWVKNRKEMRNVNVVDLNTYKPKNTQHFHIYVCEPSHVAATY